MLEVLDRVQRPRQGDPRDVVLGRLVGFDPEGAPLVAFDDDPDAAPLPARTVADLADAVVGTEVAVVFVSGDPGQPLIIGPIRRPRAAAPKPAEAPCDDGAAAVEARIDGERIELTAAREIILKCGKASIHLTRAGKVLIRGAFLLCRSSGANRIKGASVNIN